MILKFFVFTPNPRENIFPPIKEEKENEWHNESR
jgi:hypothetical protein